MTKSTNQIEVIVVGAGVVGLLIAQGLKKNGIAVTIVDSESSLQSRNRDWTMAMHWSASYVEELLPTSIFKKMRQTYGDPFYPYTLPVEMLPIMSGLTGEVVAEVPGAGMKRISRKRIRELCASDLEIQWGLRLEDVSFDSLNRKVSAKFQEGREMEADLLVGADGIHSAVRSSFLGSEIAAAQPCGISMLVTSVRYPDAEKARFVRSFHPLHGIMVHPDAFSIICTLDVKDPDDPTTWLFHVIVSFREDKAPTGNQTPIQLMKTLTKDFAEPFRSAIAWIPDDATVYHDLPRSWCPSLWERDGNVTLAGDAAHGLLPWRGQGLNHGIQDAMNIVKELTKVAKGETTLTQAKQEYNKEMVERSSAEVKLSDANAQMMNDFDRFMSSPMVRQGFAKSA